jgi:hypothetical protein
VHGRWNGLVEPRPSVGLLNDGEKIMTNYLCLDSHSSAGSLNYFAHGADYRMYEKMHRTSLAEKVDRSWNASKSMEFYALADTRLTRRSVNNSHAYRNKYKKQEPKW